MANDDSRIGNETPEESPSDDAGSPPEAMAQVARELLAGSEAGTDPTLLAHSTPSAPRSEPVPPERYDVLGEIGHGGMGVVYRAHDRVLGRDVALKVLKVGGTLDRELIERFHREARAAAALEHPNIIRVHDVGSLPNGSPYYTMELLDGTDLAHAIVERALSARQAIEAIRQVAQGLAYAHEKGILHRDIKPQNIFLRYDPSTRPRADAQTVPSDARRAHGEVHALLLDFGLAKLVEGVANPEDGRRVDTLTRSGEVFGTPAYMSPEQASGRVHEISPPSDQFSLGVVLYEVLTGRLPFAGSAVRELLNAVTEQDPPRPCTVNPRVHRDIETIALKALEKDPSKRYASMADLAADLGRYLEGEPILARPVPLWERCLRKAVRHRAVLLPTAAAVVIAAALGLLNLSERSGREEAERKAERATLLLEKSERVSKVLGRWGRLYGDVWKLETIHYDTRLSQEEKRRHAGPLWRPFEEFIRNTPPDEASQAVMWALAGWARWLAGEPSEAGDWTRRATDLDSDVPYGPLMQSLVYLSMYLEAQSMPQVITGSNGIELGPARQEDDLMQRVREDLGKQLEAAQGAVVWGKGEASEQQAALEAMRLMQAGEYRESEGQFSRALATIELRPVWISLHFARAKVRYLLKDFPGARADIEETLKVRAGQVQVWVARAAIAVGEAQGRAARGENPLDLYRQAIADLGTAIECDAEDPLCWANRAITLVLLGEAETKRGGDERATLRQALSDFDAAVRKGAPTATLLHNRGLAHRGLAEAEATHGCDPRDPMRQAISDFEAALGVDPEFDLARVELARAWTTLGRIGSMQGEDPRPAYGRALDSLGLVLARDEANANARSARAWTWQCLAAAQAERGIDPMDSYESAVEDLDRVLRGNRDDADALVNRGGALISWANAESARGIDPRERLRSSISSLEEALRRHGSGLVVYHNLCRAYDELGLAEEAEGADPRESFRRSIEYAGRALERNPRNVETLVERSTALMDLGEAEAKRGQEPWEMFEGALRDLDAVLGINPESAVAYRNRGGAYVRSADEKARRKMDARGDYEHAIADFGAALDRNPGDASSWQDRGAAFVNLGDDEGARGEDPRESYRRAIADFGEALKRNPDMAQTYANQGGAWRALGNAEGKRDGPSRECYEKAIADYHAALERNPRAWRAHMGLGLIFETLGEYAKAVESYERALRLSGGQEPRLTEWLERAKQRDR